MGSSPDRAVVGGRMFAGLAELTHDIAALDGRGQWVVVVPFDSPPVCARFDQVVLLPSASSATGSQVFPGNGPPKPTTTGLWESSLDRAGYVGGVEVIRSAIARGDVYQANLCRRLTAPLKGGLDVMALAGVLAERNPAPYLSAVDLPSAGLQVVSASPERFLRRIGSMVQSRPIKGTAVVAGGLLPKDTAENVMIVDLVRNDLGRVCDYGSVVVDGLCEVEEHPGLVHLVSTVSGRLRPGSGWGDLLEAAFPPGSVTGAPKEAALRIIRSLEPVERDVYCGAVGWIDADHGVGDLSVAIRTFWSRDGYLHLGTGAGITWDSDADREWEETELKTSRLLTAIEGRVAA